MTNVSDRALTPSTDDSASFQEVVREEQVSRLIRYMPSQYLGGIIVVSLFVAYFSGKVPDRALVIWCLMIVTLYLAGFAYMALLRNVPRSNILWTPFAYGYGVGGGLVWGVATALFFDAERFDSVLFLVPAIVGLAAIGVAGLVSYLPAVFAFLFSSLGPLVAVLLQARSSGDVYLVMAAVTTACGAGFSIAATLSHQQLILASRLRYDLRESERRFRDFAESASEWFWESDEQDRVTSISVKTITESRNDLSDLIGRTRKEFAKEDYAAHPERWRDYLNALSEHKPFRDFFYTFLGDEDKPVSVSISGNPVFDSNGVFLGYRGTGKNITQELAAADSLKSTQRQLLAAVEAYPGAFFLFDSDERLVMLNSRSLEWYTEIESILIPGTSMEDIAKAHFAAYVDNMDLSDIEGEWVDWRMNRFRNPTESHIQSTRDGRHTLVQETRTNDGGIVSVRTNISDLVGAQMAAAQANRSKSEFLANMSHELRTPLNAIIGFADAIRHEVSGPIGNDNYKDYVEHIHHSGEHLLSLISDILDVSAVEAGRVTLSESDMLLGDILNQCIALVRGRADERGLTVTVNVPDDLPSVYGDERRIKQVLINLLNNAVKFTPENGSIEVRAELDPDARMVVGVHDTGGGLNASEIAVALSPFGRTESAINGAQEGTGLGLPLSKNLMEAHGGTLEIDVADGNGCLVRIIFPANRVQGSP